MAKKAKAKKKRRKGTPAKGPRFEREQAVTYSLWWTDNERDDIFWRTDGSGSRATNRARKGKKTRFQYGDMTFTDPIGQPLIDIFSFEFKFYYRYSMLGVFHNVSFDHDWLKFWAKAWRDAEESGRRSMLVTKMSYGEPICWVEMSTMSRLIHVAGFKPRDKMVIHMAARDVQVTRNKKVNEVVQLPDHIVVGFRQAELLDVLDPVTLIGAFVSEEPTCRTTS